MQAQRLALAHTDGPHRDKEKGQRAYLCDHHMAIKSAVPLWDLGTVDVWPDLCHDGGAECDVRNEMAIHLRGKVSDVRRAVCF